MNKNRRIRKWIRITMLVLAFVAFLEGVYILNNTNQQMVARYEDAHDGHLGDLAESVDVNLRNTLRHISLDFNYVLDRYYVKGASKTLVETGDASELEDNLLESLVNTYKNIRVFLCYDQDQLLMATSSEDIKIGKKYTFIKPTRDMDIEKIYNNPIYVCHDENGEYFVAIKSKMPDPELTFYALLDFDSLYDNILMSEDIQRRWIVFYNEEGNLWVQNHKNQPSYKIMDQNDVERRQDGYTFILNQNRDDSSEGYTYDFPNEEGVTTVYRMITIPRTHTQNGLFSIAVAADIDEVVDSIDFFSRRIFFLTILFAISIMLLFIFILGFRNEHKTLLQNMKEIERTQKLKNALVQSELKNAMNQIHPHFLYNALSAIRELIYDKPEEAADMLYDFTHHLRASIRSVSQNDLIEFYEEIENINSYVNIEKMRFGDRFNITYAFEFIDFQIAPLTIQPLVENAIRHGIFERGKQGGSILITSDLVEEDAVIHVIDDGVGFDVNEIIRQVENGERDSTGLSNTILRLKNYHNAIVHVHSTPGEGTDIEIILPNILDQ